MGSEVRFDAGDVVDDVVCVKRGKLEQNQTSNENVLNIQYHLVHLFFLNVQCYDNHVPRIRDSPG